MLKHGVNHIKINIEEGVTFYFTIASACATELNAISYGIVPELFALYANGFANGLITTLSN